MHKECTIGGDELNTVEIGRRLCKLRGDRSLRDVAQAVNVSYSALAMYERGERIPRDEVKVRLARYYNRSVQSIFFDGIEHE